MMADETTERLLILGVPIDNVTSLHAATLILKMIESKHPPFYISTINSDFYANALGWNPGAVHDSELMQRLRCSAMATADGMPLVWLSRSLGNPLIERVTGVDLVLRLATLMGTKKMSIYLLGGVETVAQAAAKKLQELSPSLRIAGINCPYLDVKGLELENSMERDALILEQINQASPDLLLINLGNPKQELWFDRVQDRLKVPVSIGVGGTFSFLSGAIKRAPKWMQNWGLEWLFRLMQEPRRLFKRYFIDIIKFFYIALPLVIFHRLNGWVYRIFYAKNSSESNYDKLFISPKKTIVTFSLPALLNKDCLSDLTRRIDDAFDHDDLIFDFRYVKHIDLSALSLLVRTWMRANKEKKEIYGVGLNGDMRLLIKLHRIWDLFSHNQYKKPEEIVAHFLTDNNHATLYEAVYQENGFVILSFLGRLDNHQDYDNYYKKYAGFLHLKHCIIDLSYCTYIDNLGFTFLMKLRKQLIFEGKTLRLACISPEVKKQFKLAEVDSLFTVYKSVNEAL